MCSLGREQQFCLVFVIELDIQEYRVKRFGLDFKGVFGSWENDRCVYIYVT